MAEGDKNKLVRIQHLVEAQKKEQQEKAQVEAQLAATVEGEKNKQARIEHLVEEQKHKLESQKSQFMAQLKDKDRLIQRLDEIQVKERAELEKIKAKCAEHEKSEEVAKGTLSKYVKECAGNDRKIGELNAKVSELTKDCNNLMLRNPETKEVVDRLKKDHEVAIARLVAELQAERDGSGRQIEELRARVSELTNECQNLMLRDLENKSLVDRLKKDHDEAIAHLVTELQAARDGSERLSPTQTNTVGVQTADINHALLEEERVDSYTPAQTYTLGMQAGDIYDTSLHSVDGRPLPDPIRPASISPAPSDPRAELERVLEEAVHFVHRRVGAPVIPQPVIPQDNSPSVTTSLLTGFDPLMQAEEHIPFASDVSTYAWRNNPAYDNGNLLVSVEGGEDTESVS
ncbi:hypothetical protein GV64_18725 [Endozoicomonas elysicola]|uniref:Uncharacterized protein n=2 Tax=Endozoicomonas elysicola TaxID=305900 RepID=A0A081KEB7_9GAMM|nr:hypothetical protein GV64_18725 [Endozoicomonas elysicola]